MGSTENATGTVSRADAGTIPPHLRLSVLKGVLIGHGSLGLEILEDCPDVESVFIPVGGGGLIAGVGSALKAINADVKVVAATKV